MQTPYPGPTSVTCPYCGARPGNYCRNQQHVALFPVHAARRKAYLKWLAEQRKGETK